MGATLEKKRILFVDDEINVLSGLKRLLRPNRHKWKMNFVKSAGEALDELEHHSYDVIISDIRMPEMDGIQLLTKVSERFPRIVRIVLSGQADRELIINGIAPIHQYLSKPCDPKELIDTVEQAMSQDKRLDNLELQQSISRLEILPSVPHLYKSLVERINDPNVSVREIGDIIRQDPGMTAKILQLVNSAFFGARRAVSDPGEAVGLLGLNIISSLTLSVKLFEQFDEGIYSALSLERIWSHSLSVAKMAQKIGKSLSLSEGAVQECFTGGLLHDIGKLLLAQAFSEAFLSLQQSVTNRALPAWEAEKEHFGASHGEIGACLLSLWGLPHSIVESVGFHDNPLDAHCNEIVPLTAVHIANALVNGVDSSAHTGSSEPDNVYLSKLGLLDKVIQWRQEAPAYCP